MKSIIVFLMIAPFMASCSVTQAAECRNFPSDYAKMSLLDHHLSSTLPNETDKLAISKVMKCYSSRPYLDADSSIEFIEILSDGERRFAVFEPDSITDIRFAYEIDNTGQVKSSYHFSSR